MKKIYVRQNEEIGGGYFVFRRGDRTNRVRPGKMPFEHPTKEAATEEAARLAEMCGSAWNKDPSIGVIGVQTGPS